MAAQLGLTIPNDFSNVEGIQTLKGVTGSDLDLTTSPLYGAKVGYFSPQLNWLGVETEFFYTNPHVKQQRFTASAPLLAISATEDLTGAHVRVATWAFNLIARMPGERFQPYAGVGLGINWARVSGVEAGTASDTSPGLNALAGLRFFLTKQIALFGEYKYNRATFDFGSDVMTKGDYSANHFVFGAGYHF